MYLVQYYLFVYKVEKYIVVSIRCLSYGNSTLQLLNTVGFRIMKEEFRSKEYVHYNKKLSYKT